MTSTATDKQPSEGLTNYSKEDEKNGQASTY